MHLLRWYFFVITVVSAEEYLLVFMDIFSASGSFMRVTLMNPYLTAVDVNISQPGYNSVIDRYTVTSQSSTVHDVDVALRLKIKGNERAYKVILVQCSREIGVYGMNGRYNVGDAFRALSKERLDTEYLIVNKDSCSSEKRGKGFALAALEANTVVKLEPSPQTKALYSQSITVPVSGETLRMNENFAQITLDAFEAVQLEHNDVDFTGLRIRSSKPLAVFSGNNSPNCGGSDHLVEQLPPVSAWGRNHVIHGVAGGHVNTGLQLYKVVSAHNNTEIFVQGTSQGVIHAGGFLKIGPFAGDVIKRVTSSNVVMIARYNEGDAALLIMPHLEAYNPEPSLYIEPPQPAGSAAFQYFLSVVVVSTQIENANDMLNSPTSSTRFVDISGKFTGQTAVYHMIELTAGNHIVIQQCPTCTMFASLDVYTSTVTYSLPIRQPATQLTLSLTTEVNVAGTTENEFFTTDAAITSEDMMQITTEMDQRTQAKTFSTDNIILEGSTTEYNIYVTTDREQTSSMSLATSQYPPANYDFTSSNLLYSPANYDSTSSNLLDESASYTSASLGYEGAAPSTKSTDESTASIQHDDVTFSVESSNEQESSSASSASASTNFLLADANSSFTVMTTLLTNTSLNIMTEELSTTSFSSSSNSSAVVTHSLPRVEPPTHFSKVSGTRVVSSITRYTCMTFRHIYFRHHLPELRTLLCHKPKTLDTYIASSAGKIFPAGNKAILAQVKSEPVNFTEFNCAKIRCFPLTESRYAPLIFTFWLVVLFILYSAAFISDVQLIKKHLCVGLQP